MIFAGEADGDEAGWSVADAGNVNGATGAVDDLLIGAPDNLGIGAAYLVYGGNTLGGQATLTNNVYYINLARVGGTATGSVPGAKIVGPGATAETGFSVSPAGDFNADGFADFMIGSPTYNLGSVTLTDSGEVDLIYGSASGIHRHDHARESASDSPGGHVHRGERGRHGWLRGVCRSA